MTDVDIAHMLQAHARLLREQRRLERVQVYALAAFVATSLLHIALFLADAWPTHWILSLLANALSGLEWLRLGRSNKRSRPRLDALQHQLVKLREVQAVDAAELRRRQLY